MPLDDVHITRAKQVITTLIMISTGGNRHSADKGIREDVILTIRDDIARHDTTV
jgi:hypothetical protein